MRTVTPSWFKTGNRLITAADYEYYVKNNADFLTTDKVVDVKCMNNIEYVATFYKWLYLQGASHFKDGGRHYFKQDFWQRSDYKQVDPADGNNTYLWIKSNTYDSSYQDNYSVESYEDRLNKLLKPLKTMTTEIQVVKPVIVNFDICANPDMDDIRERYLGQVNFDDDLENYVEVTLDDNTLYVNSSIQDAVYDAIVGAFDLESCTLGQKINYSNVLDSLYSINGV